MNRKKLIILAFVLIVLIVVFISVLVMLSNREGKNNNNVNVVPDNNDNNISNFGVSVDLDDADPNSNMDTVVQSDFPGFGSIDGYYEDVEVFVTNNGSEMYVQTNDGYDIISFEWKDEGMARYVNKPDFGTFDKFRLSKHLIEARIKDVKLKDVESYIKEINRLGFTEVKLDNKGDDFYYYSASKKNITVTLNLDKDVLLITVFELYGG